MRRTCDAPPVVSPIAFAVVFAAVTALVLFVAPASNARTKATKAPTVPQDKPGTVPARVLAEVVRSAALPLASSMGAKLGVPVCPSGVKASATMAAQCIVTFDAVQVPFLVTSSGSSFLASPLFLVVERAALEKRMNGATCGKAKVLVVPAGAAVECKDAKRVTTAVVVASPQGWTLR